MQTLVVICFGFLNLLGLIWLARLAMRIFFETTPRPMPWEKAWKKYSESRK